jgi:hypothetical protein
VTFLNSLILCKILFTGTESSLLQTKQGRIHTFKKPTKYFCKNIFPARTAPFSSPTYVFFQNHKILKLDPKQIILNRTGKPDILPHDKFIIYANRNTIDSIALVEKLA